MGKKKKHFDLDRIDKLLAQFPDEDSPPKADAKPGKPILPAGVPGKQAVRQTTADTIRRRSPLFAWLSVTAGVVLAAAMTQWPYGRACGTGLGMYLLAVIAVVGVGIWAGIHAWQARLAVPHVLAIAVVLWGLGLGLFQVLPRIGYASTEATWRCWGRTQEPTASQGSSAANPGSNQGAVAVADSMPADSASMVDSLAVGDTVPARDSLPPADSAAQRDSIPARDSVPPDSIPPDTTGAMLRSAG